MSSTSAAVAASTPVAIAAAAAAVKIGACANNNNKNNYFSVDPPRPTTPNKQDLGELAIYSQRGGSNNNNNHFIHQQNSSVVSSSSAWRAGCRDAVLTVGSNGILNLPIVGGSDIGEFACLADFKQEWIHYLSGKLEIGDVILEIQGQKVAGYTQRDIEALLNHSCRNGAVAVKVTAGNLLTKDLRQYLNTRFLKGSPDHDLQNTIRDNLYLRTVPCTTRLKREGEIDGVDYTFLSIDEFLNLERSGNLLESGIYEGNHYGTPKPPRESPLLRPPVPSVANGTPPHFPNQTTILPGAHPSSEGKRRRNRSNVEAMASKSVEPNISLTSRSRTPSVNIGAVPANANNSALKSTMEKFENFNLEPTTPPELGPLPTNWEKAYTDNGEPYFIDHASGTSQWLDPRLARVQKKSIEDCEDDELPYGWEKIDDPQFGTYYIDHINRQTQYENPVLQARRMKSQQQQHGQMTNGTVMMNPDESYNGIGDNPPREMNDSYHNDKSHNPGGGMISYPVRHQAQSEPPMVQFTRNPAELRGTFITTTLVKGSRGFGFTIVGGDDEVEEFLQIKSVVPEGPAWQDGKLVQGDVLVYVDDVCVLGFTHRDVVMMFQNIPIGDCVTLEVCRGYPLPFDPDDPNTEIVTTVAVSADDGNKGLLPHSSSVSASNYDMDVQDRSQRDGKQDNNDSMMPGRNGILHYEVEETPDILDFYGRSQDCIPLEVITVGIVKGLMGFGFTIADSAHGQKVKKILDRPRCKNLAEGDVLLEINGRDVRGLEHSTVVQILKDCAQGLEATITIQRGGQSSPNKNKSKIMKMAKSFEENSNVGMPGFGKQESNFSKSFDSNMTPLTQYRSKTPTADIYGGHREKEVVPIRSKTPSAEIHNRSKSPTSVATNGKNMNIYFQNEGRSHLISGGLQTQDGGHNNVDALGPGSLYGTTGGGMRSNDVPDGWQMNRNVNEAGDGSSSRIRPTKEPLSGSHPQDHPNQAGPNVINSRYQDWPANTRVNEESYYGSNYDRGRRDGEGSEAVSFPTRMAPDQSRPLTNSNIYDTSNYYSRGNSTMVYNAIYGQNGQQPFVNSGIYGTNVNSLISNNNDDSGGQYPSNNARRQGTSFEREQPSPVTNVGRNKTNSWYGPPPANANVLHQSSVDYFEFMIHLFKQETGFGFRIVGGTEEGSQVSIGHIVPGGAADLDGRLKSGDEIVSVDNQSVLNTSHHHVVQLMGHAAQGGRVALGIRRKIQHQDFIKNRQWDGLYPYDVTVNRRENEGFGFVIISSVTRAGSTIGRIIESSPAERCGCLHVGDRILAVNGKDINDLHHGDIVNLIKDSGFSVTLTIGPPQDDASSTTSTSQKLSNASVVNAVAYSHVGDCDMLMRRNIYNSTPCLPYGPNDSYGVRRSSTYGGIKGGGGGSGGYASMPSKQLIYSSQTGRYNDCIQEENVLEDEQYYAVELFRGTRGFGFSIRGGKEFQSMPLFVLKIAEDGPAAIDGRLKTGDQFVEINGVNTKDMTHAEAIDLIKQGGASVRLLVKRCSSGKTLPKHSSHSAVPLGNDRAFESVNNQSSVVSPVLTGNLQPNNYMISGSAGSHLSPTGILNNGPLGQSSPRVVLSDQDVYYPYWQYERGPV